MGLKRSRRDSVSSSEDPGALLSRELPPEVKIVLLDDGSALSSRPALMRCSLPPHKPLEFASFEDYDVHYQKSHLNRCSECQKNFPDEHFLNLHIAENHDPINAARRDQGERTYACLVPDCDRLCSTPPKRRMHCIDKHLFPKDYDFFVINDGIDRRRSMLRPSHRRRSSTLNSTGGASSNPSRRRGDSGASISGQGMQTVDSKQRAKQEVGQSDQDEKEESEPVRSPARLRGRGGFEHPRVSGRGRGRAVTATAAALGSTETVKKTPPADPVDILTSSMSALQFVPPSVRAARGRRGRGG